MFAFRIVIPLVKSDVCKFSEYPRHLYIRIFIILICKLQNISSALKSVILSNLFPFFFFQNFHLVLKLLLFNRLISIQNIHSSCNIDACKHEHFDSEYPCFILLADIYQSTECCTGFSNTFVII